jgi:hypothetical protein
MKIILYKRSADWHASLENHPEIWGRGENINEAIGDLINAHKEEFKLEIELKYGN